MRASLAASYIVLFVVAAAQPARASSRPAPFARGIALGLFSEDAGYSYRPLLDEIRATGADHVELVEALYLHDVRSTVVHAHPRYSAPLPAVERAILDAHAAGLRVFLFPILRLEEQHHESEWRGTLAPSDPAALYASYTTWLVELARLAQRTHVELLSVGSELSTLDTDHAAWAGVVGAVRKVYRGRLTYSGNWDHYDKVAIYDLLDVAGLCGYFSLSSQARTGSTDELAARWQDKKRDLLAWSERLGKPMLFTEVGYLSQRGAAAWPWNEGAAEPVDLEDQRRCYEAFARVWTGDVERFAGVYFWNWYGWGGERSRGYTPRGKPAAQEIKRYFARFGASPQRR